MSTNTRYLPLLLVSSIILWHPVHTFTISNLSSRHRIALEAPHHRVATLSVASDVVTDTSASSDDDVEYSNDESLLEAVASSQLEDLCDQLNLSKEGNKRELLSRLRQHAQEKAQSERDRNLSRLERVAQGMDEGNAKARHTIVTGSDVQNGGDNDGDGDDDGFFYFSLPAKNDDPNKKDKAKSNTKLSKVSVDESDYKKTQSYIRAPPKLSDVEPNTDGERTVTVYSSTDRNDLTGVNAAQTSATGTSDSSTLGLGGANSYNPSGQGMSDKPEATLAGGPFGDQSGNVKRKASEKELDQAIEVITELVQNLLAMTGAPGFQDNVMPMEMEGAPLADETSTTTTPSPVDGTNVFATATNFGFVGFDASRVPTSMLTDNSNVLRVGNGEALTKVLTDFEMRSIGLDGKAADDKHKGGGHYLEVRKVATFLEGFRNAEVRRVARETATMLLDKLVAEGVKGLDTMLMTMTKGCDDSSDAGELNDSLVLYLEDAIRQQEKKFGKKIGIQGIKNSWTEMANDREDKYTEDSVSSLWNVTTGEDGEIIESLDPNDPSVKQSLEQELKSSTKTQLQTAPSLEPTEQLLILLTLLKERVKAEALFPNDERGRNLRLLAYCIHADNEKDRETILTEQFGSSLDRIDSFLELLTSSIDYAESTSHQLQPSKSAPLNIRLLNSIKATVEDIKDNQAWEASGISADVKP